MPSLADLQRRFARNLLRPDAAAETGPATAEATRLAVYRHTIRVNYRNALRATYPVVCALTAVSFFHAAVDAFVDAHPSGSGDLNVYGNAFGDFLASYPHARGLPYLPDVARLEWAVDEAVRAVDATASSDDLLAALGAIPPDQLARQHLALDASCRVLRFPYPALRIWQIHQPAFTGAADIDFDAPPEHLLVRREPGVAAIERIPAGEFAWLATLQQADLGTALTAAFAADPSFAFEEVLACRIADGTLATLRAS